MAISGWHYSLRTADVGFELWVVVVLVGGNTGRESSRTRVVNALNSSRYLLLSCLKVDCLVLQLHRIGEQLEKMNSQRMDELFSLLRDGFLLQEGLSSLSQLLLLEIIEFRATGWKMTEAAQKYYYSEVTD